MAERQALLDELNHRPADGGADASGWIDDNPAGAGLSTHLGAVLTIAVGAALYHYKAFAYFSNLYGRWLHGCAPGMPGNPATATATARKLVVRRRLLPETMEVKIKKVQLGTADSVRCNPEDTVDELIHRTQQQLSVRVRNLLWAGEILSLLGSQTLAQARVRAGATLIYTVETRPEPPAGARNKRT